MGPSPTSNFRDVSSFTPDIASSYTYDQYSLPVSFSEQELCCSPDAAYSYLLSQEFSWPASLNQPVVERTPPESPGFVHAFLANYRSNSQTPENGHNEGDEKPRSMSLEHRRERRKVQNREAQRNFRAKKDKILQESSARLMALEGELNAERAANGVLSAAVRSLKGKIDALHQEISSMKYSPNVIDWEFDGYFSPQDMQLTKETC
jgi:hypothetical protein